MSDQNPRLSLEQSQKTVLRLSTCLQHQMSRCHHTELLPLYDAINNKLLEIDNTTTWDTSQRDCVTQTLAAYQQLRHGSCPQLGYVWSTDELKRIDLQGKSFKDSPNSTMGPANIRKKEYHSIVYDEPWNVHEPPRLNYQWPQLDLIHNRTSKTSRVIIQLLKDREFWVMAEEEKCTKVGEPIPVSEDVTRLKAYIADMKKNIEEMTENLNKKSNDILSLNATIRNGADATAELNRKLDLSTQKFNRTNVINTEFATEIAAFKETTAELKDASAVSSEMLRAKEVLNTQLQEENGKLTKRLQLLESIEEETIEEETIEEDIHPEEDAETTSAINDLRVKLEQSQSELEKSQSLL